MAGPFRSSVLCCRPALLLKPPDDADQDRTFWVFTRRIFALPSLTCRQPGSMRHRTDELGIGRSVLVPRRRGCLTVAVAIRVYHRARAARRV